MVEWKEIKDICSNVFAGGTPSTRHEEYYDGDIPWIRSGEIDFNIIKCAERNITEAGYKNSSAKIIRRNSVVMAMTGATVAKTAVVVIETTANQSVCAMETNETIANYKYLYYCLANDYFKIKSSAQGALTSLNLAMIKQIQIPIPSKLEQERIVKILDTFTDSIANLKAQIDARRKQYEYYRDQLLDLEGKEGVEMKTLGGVCVKISSGKNRSKNEVGLYPVFGSTGIIAYTDDYVFDKPHILVARVGANAGYVHISYGKYDVTDNTLIVNLKENVNQKFIYHVLVHENLNQYAKGGGQPLITGSILKELQIPIPSKEEQSRIVGILDQFEAIIANLEAQLKAREKQYEYYRNKLLTFE